MLRNLMFLAALIVMAGFSGDQMRSAEAATMNAACTVESLKQALIDANDTVASDVVQLAAGCTYTLTEVDNTTFGANGLPVLQFPTIIEGNGATIERSAAGGTPAFRIMLSVADSLTVRNLTVRNGMALSDDVARGAGIRATAFLRVENSNIEGNSVSGSFGAQGGGLFASSVLEIHQSTITENAATAIDGISSGGGAWSFGTLTITDSWFELNTSTSTNGTALAAGAISEVGSISVTGSTFRNNDAGGAQATGAGVYGAQVVSITNSTFALNDAQATDDSGAGAQGGAAYSNGELFVMNSTISGNSAMGITGARGGGTNAFTTSTIARSTYNGNTAIASGGPGEGGGSYSIGALTVSNSTFSANSVGGTGNTAGGGSFSAGQTTATNVTYASNASTGTGGGMISVSNGITLGLSIVVESTGGDCAAFTTVTADDNNLDSDGSCGNAITTADAGLLPLAKNFPGDTSTHALRFDSPAVNGGGLCLNLDQRNVIRDDGVCDFGAYELSRTYGDVNCDSDADGEDVVLLLTIIAGFPPTGDSYAPCSAEWDGQQGTTVGDALFVRRIIAGLNLPPN